MPAQVPGAGAGCGAGAARVRPRVPAAGAGVLPLVRSHPQRLHDALALGLRALLDNGALGTRGKTAPHLDITISLAALHHTPGALPARGDSGQPLPLSLVRHLLPDSRLTRYVLDLRHRVIEHSHTSRTLRGSERRTKHLETGGACQSATCPHGPHPPPTVRLVPHHPDSWATTGRTSPTDTAWICENEHTQLHAGATLTLRDGRRLDQHGWLDP